MRVNESHAPPDRLDWVDAAKGLGMLAVVFGHIPNFGLPGAVSFLYLFHMPLFFLLAGMFQKPAAPAGGYLAFIQHKARQRLVPYLLFCGLSTALLFAITSHLVPAVEIKHQPLSVLRNIIVGSPEINVSLWFFPCLFCVEVMAYPFLRSRRAIGLCVAALVAVGLSLPWIDPCGLPGFLKSGVAFVALPFLLLGFHLRDRLKTLAGQKPGTLFIVGGMGASVALALAPSVGPVNMMAAIYEKPGPFYLAALGGIALTIALGCLWRRSKVLCAIGAATNVIFPLHLMFRPFLLVDVDLLTTPEQATQPSLLLGLLYLILMIAFPIGLIQLLRTLREKWGRTISPAFLQQAAKVPA